MSTELFPVRSSYIRNMGHNEKKQELHVQFQSGLMYSYSPVTKAEYEAILGVGKPPAEHSVGQWFIQYIRDKKFCERVETEPPANNVGKSPVESQKQSRNEKPKFERPHQQSLNFRKSQMIH